MGHPVLCEPCDVSGPTRFLLLVYCDHILHSALELPRFGHAPVTIFSAFFLASVV